MRGDHSVCGVRSFTRLWRATAKVKCPHREDCDGGERAKEEESNVEADDDEWSPHHDEEHRHHRNFLDQLRQGKRHPACCDLQFAHCANECIRTGCDCRREQDGEQTGCRVPCFACLVSSTESDELWALAFRAKPSGPADLTMDLSCCDKGMVWRRVSPKKGKAREINQGCMHATQSKVARGIGIA